MIYYHYSEQVKDLKNTAAMFSTRKEFCSGARRGSSSEERTPDQGEVVGSIPTLDKMDSVASGLVGALGSGSIPREARVRFLHRWSHRSIIHQYCFKFDRLRRGSRCRNSIGALGIALDGG